jgi:hypothetical protein
MKIMLHTLQILRLLAAGLAFSTSVCFAAAAGEPSRTVPQRSERPLQVPLEWQE